MRTLSSRAEERLEGEWRGLAVAAWRLYEDPHLVCVPYRRVAADLERERRVREAGQTPRGGLIPLP